MQKRDFETYQKRFRDFEILPKFSETHVFRDTIRHPYMGFVTRTAVIDCVTMYLRFMNENSTKIWQLQFRLFRSKLGFRTLYDFDLNEVVDVYDFIT